MLAAQYLESMKYWSNVELIGKYVKSKCLNPNPITFDEREYMTAMQTLIAERNIDPESLENDD